MGKRRYIGADKVKQGVKGIKVGPLPLCGEKEKGGVAALECGNLRRDRLSGALVAAGRPLKSDKLTELPVISWIDGEAGRMCIVRDGGRLRVEYLDREGAGYDAGGTAGAVKCAVMTADGKIVVMTDQERYVVRRDEAGRWSVRPDGLYPALQFVAADVMRLSADAEERVLEGSYTTRSLMLNDADTDRLTNDLLRCYRELADKTTRGGLELQPLLARYRLEGEDGEVLYRSPLVQVGAPGGVQCVDELSCEITEDGRRRGTLRLAADVYRLRLRQVTVNEMTAGSVKRLVVETSLPVHPVSTAVTAANMIGRTGSNGVALRCFLPGASVTMVSARRAVARKMQALAMRGDVVMSEALVVSNPFAGEGLLDVEVPVARSGAEGVDEEMAVVAGQLGGKVAAVDGTVARCMVPNRFLAESGCVAGEMVVWGGIKLKGSDGYRIEEMTSEVTPSGEEHLWRCVVVTEMVSGERRVATSWGTEGAPLRLSPVLSSPRADCVRMRIVLERDGVVYAGEFGMSMNEQRTASHYFSPDGRGIELEASDEAFAYVSGQAVAEERDASVMTAGRVNPAEGIVSHSAGTGKVVAMMAVDRRGSAWEFGTQRVYAMTSAGIYQVSFSENGGELRCTRIDRRGLTLAGAVAETDDDRYPVVCVAGGDLLGLSRGNVVTLEDGVVETTVGWDGVAKELWLADGSGNARVKDTLAGGWRRVEGLSVAGFHDSGRGLLIDSDLGVRDTARGESEMAEFRYRLRCMMPAMEWYDGGMELRRVAMEMVSGNVGGMMRVRSRTVAEDDAGMVHEMEFRGAVNTPIAMGLYGCYGPVIEVEVAGEMSGRILDIGFDWGTRRV